MTTPQSSGDLTQSQLLKVKNGNNCFFTSTLQPGTWGLLCHRDTNKKEAQAAEHPQNHTNDPTYIRSKETFSKDLQSNLGFNRWPRLSHKGSQAARPEVSPRQGRRQNLLDKHKNALQQSPSPQSKEDWLGKTGLTDSDEIKLTHISFRLTCQS